MSTACVSSQIAFFCYRILPVTASRMQLEIVFDNNYWKVKFALSSSNCSRREDSLLEKFTHSPFNESLRSRYSSEKHFNLCYYCCCNWQTTGTPSEVRYLLLPDDLAHQAGARRRASLSLSPDSAVVRHPGLAQRRLHRLRGARVQHWARPVSEAAAGRYLVEGDLAVVIFVAFSVV